MVLKLANRRFYRGLSVWSDQSGLLAICDDCLPLSPDAETAAQRLEGALQRLHEDLSDLVPILRECPAINNSPDWTQHPQPDAYWVVAVVEAMVRDFCWRPTIGKVMPTNSGQARLFLPSDDEGIALAALEFSLFLLQVASREGAASIAGVREEVGARYRAARQAMRRIGLNQSTIALARSATRYGIPIDRLAMPGQLTQLGQGVHARRVSETATTHTSALASALARDKLAIAGMLARAGMPTPDTQAARSLEEAMAIAAKLGFPLVVKPRSGGKGKGVAVDIRTAEALKQALQAAAKFQLGLVVERFIAGDDHRILVVGGRFVAAAKRLPAHVVGDGTSTVAELVARENLDPQRGMPFERLREKIELDAEAFRYLAQSGLGLHSIPAASQHVRLRDAANISRGGTCLDVTDLIHPDNQRLAERAARLSGIDVCGIDFISPDISRSWRDLRCAILEVNTSPGLRPHLGSNTERDVVTPIIRHLFPNGSDGRIPTVGITGSLGKTTTSRMVAAILAQAGRCVALCTTQGAWIGTDCVREGDVAGGGMAQELLRDPAVDAGVFELSRGGLLKRGSTLDGIDVGVVLGIGDNHIGADGIKSREEIAQIKSIVARSARHWVVLNADDPLCLRMRPSAGGPQACLVSARPDGSVITQHLAAGGTCVTLRGNGAQGYLRLERGTETIGEIKLALLPATLGGSFTPAVWNAMHAMAAAHCLGVEFAVIRNALCAFVSDYATNPGRMNHIEGLPFDLILTWADGPIAFGELARFVGRQAPSQSKTLVFRAAGDRQDIFILETARAVANAFDRFICCDIEKDLRGRAPGEAAHLLAEGLRRGGVPQSAIDVEPSSTRALEKALRTTAGGALLVVVTAAAEAQQAMATIRSIWPDAR